MKDILLEKIKNRKVVVGVIGLGYVGLPLLIEFSRAGFEVVGFDLDQNKIDKLTASKSYLKHIPSEKIRLLCESKNFRTCTDYSEIPNCDAVIICVPTPLTKQREPDMSYIIKTAENIVKHIKVGQLYCLESTTYPGTTEEVLKPILESSGLVAGKDFFLAYSPEREDPNNKEFSTSTIPKVVGGYNRDSLEVAVKLYDTVICETVPVSSTATAEATKLMENIFRSVNIALVNELKIIFDRMGINIWEVIEAAKTKPFGYMPFYPGPGLGGHCIPIDPFYLTWKAREFEHSTKFIELAGEINVQMPDYVVHKTMDALNRSKKSVNGSRILILGLAYKKNVDDLRESPSFKLLEILENKGAVVDYYDPYCEIVPANRPYPQYTGLKSILSLDNISGYDCVIVSTAHDCVDYDYVSNNSKLIVDTRNAIKDAPHVVRA